MKNGFLVSEKTINRCLNNKVTSNLLLIRYEKAERILKA